MLDAVAVSVASLNWMMSSDFWTILNRERVPSGTSSATRTSQVLPGNRTEDVGCVRDGAALHMKLPACFNGVGVVGEGEFRIREVAGSAVVPAYILRLPRRALR